MSVIDVLVAFCLAVLFLAVFHGPAFLIALGQFGGLAFALYAVIVFARWIYTRIKGGA